jgi:hypothetical protein
MTRFLNGNVKIEKHFFEYMNTFLEYKDTSRE